MEVTRGEGTGGGGGNGRRALVVTLEAEPLTVPVGGRGTGGWRRLRRRTPVCVVCV